LRWRVIKFESRPLFSQQLGKGKILETLMDGAIKYITDKLSKHRIVLDVGKVVGELAVANKINEFMTHSAIYTTLLLRLSREDPMYKALLSNTYPFDIEVEIDDKKMLGEAELRDKLAEIFAGKTAYIYVRTSGEAYFVGIKLNERAYCPIRNHNTTEDAIPYYLLTSGLGYDISAYKFSELIFGYEDGENEHGKYVELMAHVKQLRLPVSIVDDEMMHLDTAAQNVHACYLHCSSNENWPEAQEALKCAKTALYCFIYRKSRFRSDVGHEYVLLKYRGSYFRLQILLKEDRGSEYTIGSRIAELVSAQPSIFRKNVVSVKRFLDCHGYYPMYIDDRTVEIACLIFGRDILSFGRFFNEFLEYKFDLDGHTFNLESLRLTENQNERFELVYQHNFLALPIPSRKIIKRLNILKKLVRSAGVRLFNREMKLMTRKLLQPCLNDYDLVLGMAFMPGSLAITNSGRRQHLLGKAVLQEALPPYLRSKAYFFYSPTHALLMVKLRGDTDAKELQSVLILKTSFRFVFAPKRD
jgi:hypothetical protein